MDAPLLLLVTSIFIVLGLDGSYNFLDGILLLLLFLFYIAFLLQREDVLTEAAGSVEFTRKKHNMLPNFSIIGLSIIVLYFSAKALVYSGVGIASILGISHSTIGLVGIAIGTSLPELAVTISSAKKGNTELLLGNVIGSNISNILLIGGVAALITPIIVSDSIIYFIFPILAFVTIMLLVFMRLRTEFKQLEGVSFLLIYMFFLVLSVYLGFNA